MVRMSPERLNHQIFEKIRGYKVSIGYLRQLRSDLDWMGLRDQDCLDRDEYRTLAGSRVLVERKHPGRGRAWTEERKLKHSVFMKNMWKKKEQVKSKE